MAELLYVTGKLPEAVSHIQKAIALDPTNKYYQEQLQKFQSALGAAGSQP